MADNSCPSYPKIDTLFGRDEKFHVDLKTKDFAK